MLQLLPKPDAVLAPAASKPAGSATGPAARPCALVYTMLRHGRGLSRAEAAHRLREQLLGPGDGPVTAA